MFRFTIRDVLWLTVVVAITLTMSLAWRADSERHKQAETSLRKAIHEIRDDYLDQLQQTGRSPLDAKLDRQAAQKSN